MADGGSGAASAKQSAKRVIQDLKTLKKLTSDERGAQRVAWGPVWRKAREWFAGMLRDELGLETRQDGAANLWATLPGKSKQSLVLGSHLDSVPGGGWLDGCLGVLAGLEVLRRYKALGEPPPLTIHLVDWADEEGARFGRSLTGSAASAGSLDPHKELSHLTDRNGAKLPDALAENGITLEGMKTAKKYFDGLDCVAYLELHIEQGPVLDEMKAPVGVVLGTMGVERHQLKFIGQAASGSAPLHLRQDAFLAAAEFALAAQNVAVKLSGKTPKTRVVATCGVVKVEPNFVTAVPGRTEISIDLRALDKKVLAKMYAGAKKASLAAAKKHKVKVEWSPLLHITPRIFDATLTKFVRESVKEVSGRAPEIPSGPLHDAAEMADVVPTCMVFAQSSPGVSHTKIEDTPEEALDQSIRAFFRVVEKSMAHFGS
jgi:allantoate deiminase